MRRNKRIIYAAVFIASLAVVLFYLYERTGQINRINAEIAKVRTEKLAASAQKAEPRNYELMFPEKAAIAPFVEDLYDAARASGIKKYEVSTLKTGDVPIQRNMIKGKAAESGKVLKTYSFKISLEGDYRETAEYIRELQNIGRFKRILELGMKPADKLLRTDIAIEIYSVGGQDAAQ